MTQQEFINNIKQVKGNRNHKIKNSIGVEDFLKTYNFSKFNISVSDVRQIIKLINKELAEQLSQGNDIKFPRQMGGLEIRSSNTYVKLKNGNLHTNRHIDWQKTLQLWYNDKEAHNLKKLVRLENKKIYTIFYNRGASKYNNKVFYEFIPNRTLKQKLKLNINKGLITDTFALHD